MKSLFDLFNEILVKICEKEKLNYESISDFITDDKKAATFINSLSYDNANIILSGINTDVSQARARHSVITLFLGYIFFEFAGIRDIIFKTYNSIFENDNNNDICYKLWRDISINHDYGYFSSHLKNFSSRDSLGLKYDLLTSKEIVESKFYKSTLKLDLLDLLNYFNYSIEYHKKEKYEKVDHGILGACLIYSRELYEIFKENSKNKIIKESQEKEKLIKSIYLYYQIVCLTIAQHNVFKSKNEESDKIYKKFNLNRLLSNSDYSVNLSTPLLGLLSLVDTIECVKKFSRSVSSESYLETITVLKNIDLEVTTSMITIDASKLYNIIRKKNTDSLKNTFETWISNITGIGKWTGFICEDNTLEEKFYITLAK